MLRQTRDTTSDWDAQFSTLKCKQRWWPSEELIAFVYRACLPHDQPKHASILELGCGTGNNLWFLSELGYQVTGYDHSPAALRAAQEYLTYREARATFVQQTFQLLAEGADETVLEEGRFTGIVDVRATQHITWSDHARLYKWIWKHLTSGGWFFTVHVNNGTSDASYHNGQYIDCFTIDGNTSLGTVFPGCGVLCLPSHMALVHALRDTGFIEVEADQVRRSSRGGSVWASYSIISAKKPKE